MSERGPERRLNLLTGDHVLVSPQRLKRPWQGELGSRPQAAPSYDPACYLCPGNPRAGGIRNPAYDGVFVFDNDFPALLAHAAPTGEVDPILQAEPEAGRCRVICYAPDHALSMSEMSPAHLKAVVAAWSRESEALAADGRMAAVTLFENRGAMMGASNPHPHGQIWATSSVPNELRRENSRQTAWLAARGRPLLSEYLERERAAGDRILTENPAFTALVPFWAAWPFEVLVLPRRPVGLLAELTGEEAAGLAEVLSRVTQGFDRLFEAFFPYTFGIHQRPLQGGPAPHFILHGHFYPPLLRSATIRKFMVGFEMLAMPQRDLTPEDAADRLRAAMARGV